MKFSPLLSAVSAIAYIGIIVTFLQFMESIRSNTPDTILDGIGFISLVVFSAAVMAFLFFYRPVSLLVEHKQAEAVSHFLKTLGIFGAFTVLLLVTVSVL